MKTVVKLAAIALIAAPTFAAAGSKNTAVMESDVFVDTTPVPAGSSGSRRRHCYRNRRSHACSCRIVRRNIISSKDYSFSASRTLWASLKSRWERRCFFMRLPITGSLLRLGAIGVPHRVSLNSSQKLQIVRAFVLIWLFWLRFTSAYHVEPLHQKIRPLIWVDNVKRDTG